MIFLIKIQVFKKLFLKFIENNFLDSWTEHRAGFVFSGIRPERSLVASALSDSDWEREKKVEQIFLTVGNLVTVLQHRYKKTAEMVK